MGLASPRIFPGRLRPPALAFVARRIPPQVWTGNPTAGGKVITWKREGVPEFLNSARRTRPSPVIQGAGRPGKMLIGAAGFFDSSARAARQHPAIGQPNRSRVLPRCFFFFSLSETERASRRRNCVAAGGDWASRRPT